MTELPDAPLHANDVTDEKAWAYERMVARLLRKAIIGQCWEVPRTVLGVDVRGHYPSAQIVISFRENRTGAEGEAEWELWDKGAMNGAYWEAPSNVASAINASWPRPDVVRMTRPASGPDE